MALVAREGTAGAKDEELGACHREDGVRQPLPGSMGGYEVLTSKEDGWTVTTKDNSLTAQFEHTVLVTPKGYEILTKV